jgi:hypothetical protein
MHSRIQFIRTQKKLRYFDEFKVDPVKRKSARCKQKWLYHVNNFLTVDLSEEEEQEDLDDH